MAAPMDVHGHARVLLHFNNRNAIRTWILITYAEQPTIGDVSKAIVDRHRLAFDITLHLKDAWLPPWEKSLILKDDDCVDVRRANPDAIYSNDELQGSDANSSNTENLSARKRKRKDREALNDSVPGSSYSSTNVKKKKKSKTDKDSETTQHNEESGASGDTEQLPVSKTKKKKTDSDRKTNAPPSIVTDTLCVNTEQHEGKKKHKKADSGKGFEPAATAVDVANDKSEVENDVNVSETDGLNISISSCDGVQSEEKKKRKRIRKHRKRKKGSLDHSQSSCSENPNSSTERVDKYKGKSVQQDELFFGSIPDKLVSPKYYRHGYRNLNVYQPEPNKHQVFKSDSEEEAEVQQNTEQYNFLSSTKILEERDQYRLDAELSEKDQEETVIAGSYQVNGSAQGNLLNVKGEYGMKTAETEARDKHAELVSGLRSSPEFTAEILTHDKNPMECESTVFYRSNNFGDSSSPAPSPSVLSKETLPNGVSVFKRDRRNRSSRPPRELSKAEQLNTEATNISTIFKVPVVPKMMSPRTSQLYSASQTVISSNQSEKTNGSMNSQSESSSLRYQTVSPPQFSRNDYSTEKSSRLSDSPSTETLVTQSAGNSSKTRFSAPDSSEGPDIESGKGKNPEPSSNGTSAVHTQQVSDYTKCPQLKGRPDVGMIIAYRVLEISVSCTPEVSAYKEAEVLAVDDSDMVTLKSLLPTAEVQFNKFHVELEDEDTVLTNTAQQAEQVTLHVSSLLEARVIKQPPA